jgi:hypothetical protein
LKRRGVFYLLNMKRSTLITKLDRIFSKYIRLRATDYHGYGECFTCGKRKHWKEVDAGHFQSRGKYSVRWDEDNVQFQCKGCNMKNGGQQYVFGKNLDARFGEGTADRLVSAGHKTQKFATFELEEMVEKYNKLVREMLE